VTLRAGDSCLLDSRPAHYICTYLDHGMHYLFRIDATGVIVDKAALFGVTKGSPKVESNQTCMTF
jgi:hypothetical protein